jgi:hypothetical protein
MIYKPFSAQLVRHLDRTDMYLPLAEGDLARLANLLDGGESTLLVLQDGMNSEEIKVREECGDVIIAERGLGGTEVWKFPRGSTLCFKVTLSVVKDLICNWDCCQEEGCPCEQVSNAGVLLPAGRVGVSWQGVVIFNGTTPIQMLAKTLPSWMTVTYSTRTATLSGTPSAVGTFTVEVAATNCSGSYSTVQSGTVSITN